MADDRSKQEAMRRALELEDRVRRLERELAEHERRARAATTTAEARVASSAADGTRRSIREMRDQISTLRRS